MKHKIMLLLLTIFLGASLPSFAQSARESSHVVQPGETLAVIAARYEVDLAKLAAFNGIHNRHRIYSWQTLAIPGRSDIEARVVADARTHIIRYGETLGMIAERYDADLTELKVLNNLYGQVIYPGHELLLPAPAETTPPVGSDSSVTTQNSKHIVQHGETLGTIAAEYGISLNELLLVNGLFNHLIHPGQELTLPDANGTTVVASATSAPTPEPAPPLELGSQLSYIVRHGDTLGDLARHFGITWPAIMKANDIIYPYHIYVGQHLWIPSTGSPALNVKNVEPAPVYPAPSETTVAPATASAAETEQALTEGPPPGDYVEHTIQHGETLGILAFRYGVTVEELIAANNVSYPHHIYAGQKLWIPSTAAAGLNLADDEPATVNHAPPEAINAPTAESPAETAEALPEGPPPGDYVEHTIQHAETLGILAVRYGVTVQELIAVNDISYPHHIFAGQQLWIPSTAAAESNVADDEPAPVLDAPSETINAPTTEIAAETAEPTTEGAPIGDYFEHTVQYGETLGILAIHYGLTVRDLQAANNIDDANRIETGQSLRIPASAKRRDPPPTPQLREAAQAPQPSQPAPAPATEVASQPLTPGERDVYIVQPNDSLSMIGKQLATDWVVMAAINGIASPYNLHVGMTLWVPNSDDLIQYDSIYAPAKMPNVPDPGARVGVGREFVVILDTQMAYAYENGVLQKKALISSGLSATPTVTGDFKIRRKVRKQTMSGPGYSLDNVEWVMYFYAGYAFHGTWWHTNFGQPQSKGCINMTNADAKWFYDFASLGTPVHVRYY